MTERWRKPAEVLDIQPINEGIWLPDGRVLGGVQLTLSEETIERMRLGYMCAKCQEPFEHAWPVRCPLCGAPIRDKQAEYFEHEFVSTPVELGSKTPLDDGGIHERAEREE